MHKYIDAIAENYPGFLANFWWSLGDAGPRYFLYAEITIAVVLWAWAMHAGVRWALGHKKALGTWWNRQAYRNLMQQLENEQHNGRVLAFEEVNALNEFKFGKDFKRIVNRAYGDRLK